MWASVRVMIVLTEQAPVDMVLKHRLATSRAACARIATIIPGAMQVRSVPTQQASEVS